MSAVRSLWRHDLPRQVLIAFLAAMAGTAAIGWLISVLDQVTVEEIAKAEVRGNREAGFDGYDAAFERGRLDGQVVRAVDLPDLLTTGEPQDGFRRAYDFAWNDAIDTALLRSKRDKLEVGVGIRGLGRVAPVSDRPAVWKDGEPKTESGPGGVAATTQSVVTRWWPRYSECCWQP